MKGRNLLDIMTSWLGKRVLIIGDVMLDEYIWGEVRRISPEAPVPVVEFRKRTYVLGGAGNTAANVATLGGRAILGGVVGEDSQATLVRENLSRLDIEYDGLLVDPDRPTTTKTRIIARNQQVVRLDREDCTPISARIEEALLGWVSSRLAEVDVVVLSDYAKGVVTYRVAGDVIRMARASGRPIVVDPKGRDYRKYQGATVVTPNFEEARLALNHLQTLPADLVEIGKELLDLLEGSTVLITRGAEGMDLFRPDGRSVHIPAIAVHVYDVTGAGDTVVATLSLAVAAGADLEDAARLANTAAGIVVGKVGTATVDFEELATRVKHMRS